MASARFATSHGAVARFLSRAPSAVIKIDSNSTAVRLGSKAAFQLAMLLTSPRKAQRGSIWGRVALFSLPHVLLNRTFTSQQRIENFALPLACQGVGPERSKLRRMLATS